MDKILKKLQEKALKEIEKADTIDSLRKIEIKILGRKGFLTKILRNIKDLPEKDKPSIGKLSNKIKNHIKEKIEESKQKIENFSLSILSENEWIDITAPGIKKNIGHKHLIPQFIEKIEDVFSRMGFDTAEGLEIESDYNNFTALNIPPDHPARDSHDTFFIKDDPDMLLRTQTSPVQIRYMKKHKPPIRVIAPGKTYRRDSDATHSPMFHQFEGLMIDKNVSMANLKFVLLTGLREILEENIDLRFRISFFPFVEPGAEVDISCVFCRQKGCSICKKSGWLEVAGAGMAHPKVLENGGIDPRKYTGFAFGAGIERLIMLKYKIPHLRMFFENDLRFLYQF